MSGPSFSTRGSASPRGSGVEGASRPGSRRGEIAVAVGVALLGVAWVWQAVRMLDPCGRVGPLAPCQEAALAFRVAQLVVVLLGVGALGGLAWLLGRGDDGGRSRWQILLGGVAALATVAWVVILIAGAATV